MPLAKMKSTSATNESDLITGSMIPKNTSPLAAGVTKLTVVPVRVYLINGDKTPLVAENSIKFLKLV